MLVYVVLLTALGHGLLFVFLLVAPSPSYGEIVFFFSGTIALTVSSVYYLVKLFSGRRKMPWAVVLLDTFVNGPALLGLAVLGMAGISAAGELMGFFIDHLAMKIYHAACCLCYLLAIIYDLPKTEVD